MLVLRQAARRFLAFSRPTLSTKLSTFANASRSTMMMPVAGQRHQRWFATPPPQVKESTLQVERYHALADSTMDTLLESLEVLLDDVGDANYEVEYHSGVLTLRLGEQGTYVINKQPPNKQIWLSSPFSGPKRYDYSESVDNWVYSRDGHAMGELLNEELTKELNRNIDLQVGRVSQLI